MAAIKITEGFNLGYCRAKPGKGPMVYNHDTNEHFIHTRTWRCSSIDEKGNVDYVDAEPFDVVSFPAGCARHFENVTKGDPTRTSILMFVIGVTAHARSSPTNPCMTGRSRRLAKEIAWPLRMSPAHSQSRTDRGSLVPPIATAKVARRGRPYIDTRAEGRR